MENKGVLMPFKGPSNRERSPCSLGEMAVDHFVVEWQIIRSDSSDNREPSPLQPKPVWEEFIAEWSILTPAHSYAADRAMDASKELSVSTKESHPGEGEQS